VETETIRFHLVWEQRPAVTSRDVRALGRYDDGVNVYRLRFPESGKTCTYVGETEKGVRSRIAANLQDTNPSHYTQARIQAALSRGDQIEVNVLSAASTVVAGDKSRPLDLANADERLLIEAMAARAASMAGDEVLNTPKINRSEQPHRGNRGKKNKASSVTPEGSLPT